MKGVGDVGGWMLPHSGVCHPIPVNHAGCQETACRSQRSCGACLPWAHPARPEVAGSTNHPNETSALVFPL